MNANPINIFNNPCPDNILANNRIDKLKILEKYEISSIIINKGAIKIGVPVGKKLSNNLNPL